MADRNDVQVFKPMREAKDGPNGTGSPDDRPFLRGTVQFSLNGYQLVVVQDLQLAADLDESAHDLPCRLTQVAGCVAVGGDTYTIFSLETAEAADDGTVARQHPIDFLTQRELQIATLVMQGKVNKQIAHRLHIAPNTVQSHLKRIFCKLGVTSRAAMVAHLAGCLHPLRISR